MVKRRDFVTGAGAALVTCISSRFAFGGDETRAAANSGLVPPSVGGLWNKRGLQGNSNYYLYNGGKPITGLSVVVDVTENIVAPFGFNIQLNAYSPADAASIWQQYCLGFFTDRGPTPKIGYSIEGWPAGWAQRLLHEVIGSDPSGEIYNFGGNFATLPAGFILGAGYQFKIVLAYDPKDTRDAVVGATFSVTDDHGKTTSTGLKLIQSASLARTKVPVAAELLDPIVAFQLNIVGMGNSYFSYLESGAGTITYAATSPMTVFNKHPPGTAAEGIITAEESNVTYGQLDAGPSRQFTQTLGTSRTPMFWPGGALAVSRRFDADETALFAISISGQLVMFSVDAAGRWKQSRGYGPFGMAHPHTAVAVSKRFGIDGQTGVFLFNQYGQLQALWVTAHGVTEPVPVGSKGGGKFTQLAASQAFGIANQTDVFFFDNDGQLNVHWVQGVGSFNGPLKIGPAGIAPGGAPLAASQRFGVDQTDVFAVDKTGALKSFWIKGTGPWGGPGKISDAGLVNPGAHVAAGPRAGNPNQTDAFVVDKHGQLSVFSIVGSGAWIGPVPIGPKGLADAGAPIAVSTRPSVVQTEVFVVDKQGTLNVFSVDGGGIWSEAKKISQPGVALSGAVVAASPQFGAANQTDVFLINQTGTNAPGWPVVFAVDAPNGDWVGPKALVTEV